MKNMMQKESSDKMKRSYTDKIFNICNPIVMCIFLVIFAYPLWYVLISSFSDPYAAARGDVWLLPVDFTLECYEMILMFKQLWTGYGNTIIYTVVGTVLNLIMSVCFAYPLSQKDFVPKKLFLLLFMFTMYFSGGMIPRYLVVRNVGILDTRWAMILPGLINVYNCLIVRSYFVSSIPGELQEAATIDGANSAQYLWKIVLPLSKPVLAVVGLYYMVEHWNDYYTALLYIYDNTLLPLQSVLRNLLSSTQLMSSNLEGLDRELMEEMQRRSMGMKYGIIIVAAVPVLCVYPFIQKFFVKGVMVGSVKG